MSNQLYFATQKDLWNYIRSRLTKHARRHQSFLMEFKPCEAAHYLPNTYTYHYENPSMSPFKCITYVYNGKIDSRRSLKDDIKNMNYVASMIGKKRRSRKGNNQDLVKQILRSLPRGYLDGWQLEVLDYGLRNQSRLSLLHVETCQPKTVELGNETNPTMRMMVRALKKWQKPTDNDLRAQMALNNVSL